MSMLIVGGLLALMLGFCTWLVKNLLKDKANTQFSKIDRFIIKYDLQINIVLRSIQIGFVVGILGLILLGVNAVVSDENTYAVSLGILIGLGVWWCWLAISGLVRFMSDYEDRTSLRLKTK